MNILQLLNVYAPVAIALFILGTLLRLSHWLKAVFTKRKFSGVSPTFYKPPEPKPPLQALKEVLFSPVKNFYLRANRTWALGYIFYHIAIVTILSGYAISALILAYHILLGHPVPDISKGIRESFNYSIPNMLAIIFGNAEHLQSEFLFGRFATAFVAITWVAVLSGLFGNFNLLLTVVRGKSGAVLSDIDRAAKNIRTPGHFSFEHVFVTLLVFGIIWTEILARLQVFPGIVYYHALLGLTIFAVFPFTYLFHIVFAFIAVYYATKRRINRTIA